MEPSCLRNADNEPNKLRGPSNSFRAAQPAEELKPGGKGIIFLYYFNRIN